MEAERRRVVGIQGAAALSDKLEPEKLEKPRGKHASSHKLEILLIGALFLLLAQVMAPLANSWWYEPRPGKLGRREFSVPQGSLDALVYLPKDFDFDEGTYPLLVFLHGSGDRGSDVWKLAGSGPAYLASKGQSLPCLVVCPQCPLEARWQSDWVKSIVSEMVTTYHADKARVYLSGYSMGGIGTWEIGATDPMRYAALVPIAGSGDTSLAKELAKVPVWAFHGEKDEVIPMEASDALVTAIRGQGGQPKSTVYANQGHAICSEPFRSQEMWNWLLEQKRQ
jgi:predicted peptidase